MNHKKLAAAAILGFALASSPLQAGGMAEPLMEAEVIEEQASQSGGIIVPLLILAVLVAVISNNGGGGGGGPLAAKIGG